MPIGVKDKVRFNEANQTLTFEAPEGRPSADGTVTFYDPRYKRGETGSQINTGIATRKSVSTTLNGAAGPSQSDPTNVPLTAVPAALRIGDYVWITHATSSVRERVQIAALGASSVKVAWDLVNDYASGAAFESAEMTSPAIDSTWIAVENNIIEDVEAEWVYTYDGKTRRHTTRFDVVRELVDFTPPEEALFDRYPDMRNFTFRSAKTNLNQLRKVAVRDVDAILRGRGLDPDRLRGNETVQHMVELRWAVIAADNALAPNNRDKGDFYQARLDEWTLMSNLVLNGKLKLPYDVDHNGAVTGDERAVTVRRLIR